MNIELIQSIIGKLIFSIIGGAGLLFTTEKIIVEVNYFLIFLIIINALVFAYGLHSLIKDFPKIKNMIKEALKKQK